MTNKELKERITPLMIGSIANILNDPTGSIANILNDPTIVHKIDQIQGLIFNSITGQYWDNVVDEDEVNINKYIY